MEWRFSCQFKYVSGGRAGQLGGKHTAHVWGGASRLAGCRSHQSLSSLPPTRPWVVGRGGGVELWLAAPPAPACESATTPLPSATLYSIYLFPYFLPPFLDSAVATRHRRRAALSPAWRSAGLPAHNTQKVLIKMYRPPGKIFISWRSGNTWWRGRTSTLAWRPRPGSPGRRPLLIAWLPPSFRTCHWKHKMIISHILMKV